VGLMDGLSVTVVPKERAGMASGIFNSTKVAREGVALAVVSAALAVMTAACMGDIASLSPATYELLPEVAQRPSPATSRMPRPWYLKSLGRLSFKAISAHLKF
jgi:hypothetical protein